MSADVINLRKARKAKARAERQEIAGQNRVRFGRTKAERQLAQSVRELHEARLDKVMIAEPDTPSDRRK